MYSIKIIIQYFILDVIIYLSFRNIFTQYFLKNKQYFYSYLNHKSIFSKKTSKSIIINKTDAIGDYLLFRPFLNVIKSSYPNQKIILIGNIQWKQISESFDSKNIDEFIWIDKKKIDFNDLNLYTIDFLLKVSFYRCEKAIYPVYSRDYAFGDLIMSFIYSKDKISYIGDDVNLISNFKNDEIYTKLIKVDEVHDFDKHKFFFEKLINRKINQNEIDFDLYNKTKKINTITICPGSSQTHKMWPNSNWILTIDFLLMKYPNYSINILGGIEISEFGKFIDEKYHENDKINNLINQTTLLEVIEIISQSSLLITVDSMSVHIGYQTNTPTICIYKGNHYGRFLPYNNASKFKLCVPNEIKKISEDKRKILFGRNEGLTIELITFDLFISDFELFIDDNNALF
jgi:ADP-heptose:LPS heptosyltransferase